MKKYFIVEEMYCKEKNTAFELMYPIVSPYDDEIFNTLEECREFCKKNNIKTYDIHGGVIYHYWIEDREINENKYPFLKQYNSSTTGLWLEVIVDKDEEIISNNYECYPIDDTNENETLIYDYNTELYEIVDNIYGYDNLFKVAEQLFMKNVIRNNFYYVYSGYVIRYGTLYYHGHEIMSINDTLSLKNKLNELGMYNDIIHDYMSGIKEVIFVKEFRK